MKLPSALLTMVVMILATTGLGKPKSVSTLRKLKRKPPLERSSWLTRTLSAVPDLETYEKVLDTAPVSLGPAVKRVADSPLSPLDTFARRHIGPVGADATAMLEVGSRAALSATRALPSP